MSSPGVDIALQVSSNVLLFLLIFGMSATVESKQISEQLRNKYAIFIGILMQFVIMPTLGFVALKSLGDRISDSIGIVLLVVTSSPGGSYSNWWCSLFNADLALSVAMTALSTLFSTFFLPLNLLLLSHATFGRSQDSILNKINWSTLFVSLAIVICAIVTGLVAGNYYKTKMFRRWANRFGSISGLLLIIFSALINSLSENSGDGNSSKMWSQNWAFYVGVSFPCIAGLLLSNTFSYAVRLSPPERVTLSVECCYQNVGIATSVAVSMFDDTQQRAEALGVPLFYGLVEAVVLAIYCSVAWKQGWTKAPKEENICSMLSNTYEVQDTDDDCTKDTEDMELSRAVDGSVSLQLQEVEITDSIDTIQKRRGDSVDTDSSLSTTSSASCSGLPDNETESQTVFCSPQETNARIAPVEPPHSARRRTSPFVSTRKQLQF